MQNTTERTRIDRGYANGVAMAGVYIGAIERHIEYLNACIADSKKIIDTCRKNNLTSMAATNEHKLWANLCALNNLKEEYSRAMGIAGMIKRSFVINHHKNESMNTQNNAMDGGDEAAKSDVDQTKEAPTESGINGAEETKSEAPATEGGSEAVEATAPEAPAAEAPAAEQATA
jgi:hypothetical protein